ncbi:MAG: hypothetical protein A3J76_03470 [Candidatus Moranbacteria bacterium RBG_13_45_13]|nr:MAG: hypothetical protein A3J76_03470 [Candidatus Moranbacteria bacterium RBG_13_45_13]
MKTKKYSKGFTLIELLVVIAIIGILAGVVLVSIASGRDRARVGAAKQTMMSLIPFLVECNMRLGVTPTTHTNPGGGNAVTNCPGAPAYPTLGTGSTTGCSYTDNTTDGDIDITCASNNFVCYITGASAGSCQDI